MLGVVFLAVIASLTFAAGNFLAVKRKESGLPIMNEIAAAIEEGADAFIRHEYSVIFKIAIIIAVILGILVSWYTGVAFLIGAIMSSSAGWIGMRIAVIANVRVSNTARTTKSLGDTLKVAFHGG